MSKVKLSSPGKMPCPSWSLQAIDTCPGAHEGGKLVPACAGCYATGGNYRFPAVVELREYNKQDWQRDDWVEDMIAELQNLRYFRWFDSGDMYHEKLAQKIYLVMRATPWCNHWLPTRMHKFPKFGQIISQMSALPNVVVRLSSDSVYGDLVHDMCSEHTSTIIPHEDVPHLKELRSITVCEAYERGGKCDTCRACWDKNVQTIAYPAHGAKMAKVIASTKSYATA